MKTKLGSLVQLVLIPILILASCTSDKYKEFVRTREFNEAYSGKFLNRIAFPIGGMGAGMVCLEGNGCISHVSIRHKPEMFNEPFMFGAISIKGLKNGSKVLEGPVQDWKIFGDPGSGNGAGQASYGFPRFESASFLARFPFATIDLKDKNIPMDVQIKGWSPFIPTDADNSSLPVGSLEYTFKNISSSDQDAVFSYNSSNFMAENQNNSSVIPINNGFAFVNYSSIAMNQGEFHSRNSAKGLLAEYYNNKEFKGTPVLVRTESKVDMVWETSPAPGVNSTDVSIRWTGYIKVPESGRYKFVVSGDDGYRLYVNNNLIIDNWNDHAEIAMDKYVELDKNEEYPVKLEYYQGQGGAAIHFSYGKFTETDADKGIKEGFAIFTNDPNVVTDYCWFRGGWFDARTMLWKDISNCRTPSREPQSFSPGSSIYVPFKLKPGESKTIKVMLAWYVPKSELKAGKGPDDDKQMEPSNTCASTNAEGNSACCAAGQSCSKFYEPWYSSKFKDIKELISYWRLNYDDLKAKSELFTNSFYSSDLPPVVLEAIAANLTILKSPTVLRQKDGRLWGWEGCGDGFGCCQGSCTHVWNYAQAIPNLFPALERTLRETEFFIDQNDEGHQMFRAGLPIRNVFHDFYAASDGQLGGIMKVYREWRISGDNAWLKKLWPQVKQSFDYCSKTWDPNGIGALEEPHHNTYDIEFWGPEGMCTSFYLGATYAMTKMGKVMGEDVSGYETLLKKGKKFIENDLYNGEYFIQKIKWQGLKAANPATNIKLSFGLNYSDEAKKILVTEGPKYQYGTGCLSDGVLGCWIAEMCGLGEFLDQTKVKSHLNSVYKYNFRTDLTNHVNPQRPSYAYGKDGGLLLCTWPKGGELSLPFVYSNEIWTGIEYQVASHLMLEGSVKEGLDIVEACRKRYDGEVRNPFDEYECGHWYARAMSSYGLIQGLTGLRYDAIDKTLYVDSKIGDNFKCFFSTATGFGMAGLKDGKPFIDVKYGYIDVVNYMVSGKKAEKAN
jgi:uncharacterized protein (DUF608 family)